MGEECIEKMPQSAVVVSSSAPSQSSHTPDVPDIEHAHVHDDPRQWSKGRKVCEKNKHWDSKYNRSVYSEINVNHSVVCIAYPYCIGGHLQP